MADTTVRRDGRARAGFLTRLYTGTGAFDVVGRRKLWYALFGTLVLVCIGSIVFRGFNLGIDFTGGTQVQFPAAGSRRRRRRSRMCAASTSRRSARSPRRCRPSARVPPRRC